MTRALAAAMLGLALAPGAFACGVCVDDKVAVAYDHAVVVKAAARGHVVVFAEVAGASGPAADAVAAAKAAAMRLKGVDRDSVRGAPAPAAISFALDPAERSPEQALAAVARAAGLRLTLLRVMR